ncbi:MAG TPA: stage II sporulation protein R [Caproiciproducens sp.]|nr:stage II sporulation protein R [Caproiciproducens sp.]
MKLIEKSICLALVLTVLLSFTGLTAGCEDISSRVLRLHVLANSDSSQDQALKLKVRDRILKESAGMFDHIKNKDEAERTVREKLPRLQSAAADEIQRQGYHYPVQVELTNMYFTTRQYNTVTLPAGNYDALRVTIGKAQGHNWWCVIYPAMCLPAAEEPKKLSDVLNANQLKIVENKNGYQVKFLTVEWYEKIKNYMEKH